MNNTAIGSLGKLATRAAVLTLVATVVVAMPLTAADPNILVVVVEDIPT